MKLWANAPTRGENCRRGWALAARAMVTVGPALALGGCDIGVLDPRGPIGAAEKTILFNSLAIMLAIVVPTIIATLGFAWWFRASNPNAVYLPDWEFSGRIELVVWSIPLLVILFLGGIAWVGAHDLDPYKTSQEDTKPLEVQVVSLDWKWLFIYPEQGVASINQLIVPTRTPLHFTLTSASVMSAFFVPQLGSMIYTMNGMTTQLQLQADADGEFDGLSAHFNGDGFSDMNFVTKAMSQDAFFAWVDKAKAGGPTLDTASYQTLAKPSQRMPPSLFSTVEAGLFDAVVSQKIPPAPGPTPSVSPKPGD